MFRTLLSILLFFILQIIPTLTQAQTRQGYDALGMAMYCNNFLAAPKMEALSTLLNTFGDPLPCVEKRIQMGGLKVVQVDLRDATCFRNRVCPPGTPSLTDWKVMLARAQSVNKLAVKYPEIDWWVSPWLEHDIKDANTVRKGCQVAIQGCPSCKCINSPVSGARPPELKLELHGTKSRAFSVSGDGSSIFDGDNIRTDGNKFEHRVAGSDQTYAWFNELNLRCSGEKSFTPPLKRTEKPSAALFRQAYLNMQPEPPKPAAPPQCKRVREVSLKNEIGKPNAEAYCNGQKKDPRGNKPLLIIQKRGSKGQKLKVRNSAGKEVGCFLYWGTYDAIRGAHRWYMGNCSGQNPVEFYDALGGEWGFVELGGGECLLTNAVRRLGIYR